jgi:A/G-specific adenine glycosylase
MTLAAGTEPRKRAASRSSEPQPAGLLAWYDRHRRVLPWRAARGETPDPYRVWLSEIMLQQTTVKAVAPYFARFTARWPDVRALAAAPLDDVLRLWAGLGYYARARNLRACARAVVEHHGGRFPPDEVALAALPGIGPYTAAAIAAIAFDARAAPVDGNIERVVARLFAVENELPAAKAEIRRLTATLIPPERAGDFAQALMDLGATICTPKKPACALCPWLEACAARTRGDPETFPLKARKREGRLRRGSAFVVVRADGFVLLRSREPKGLLGGMTEVPTSDWTHDFDERGALKAAPRMARVKPEWRRVPGVVTHVFTHFPLELVVYTATVGPNTRPPAGARWVALAELAGEALPNVMRKVLAHAFPSAPPIANGAPAALMGADQRPRRAT